MPTPTMNKEDVKLSYATLSALKWDEIKTVCGRAAPQTAQAMYTEMRKRLNAKELKKPSAKVGLIKGNLFLRFKDGSTHLGDVLLVRAWKPVATSAASDPALEARAKDFIESRKLLQQKVLNGKRILKAYLTPLEGYKLDIDKACLAAQTAKRKNLPPDTQAVSKAKTILEGAGRLKADSHKHFDKEVHPIFETHRQIALPEGLTEESISGWGKSFYLTVGTEYNKAAEYLKMIDTTVDQIGAAVESLTNWTSGAVDALALHTKHAAELQSQSAQEWKAMQDIFDGTSSIEQLAENITQTNLPNLLAALKSGNDKLALANADTATVKVQKAGENYKLMQKHWVRLQQLSGQVSGIPSGMVREVGIAPHIKAITDDLKAAKEFVKQQQKLLEAGLKAYQEVRKALSAKAKV